MMDNKVGLLEDKSSLVVSESDLRKLWYAGHTKSNCEFKARDWLTDKSFQAFIPSYRTMGWRMDHRKVIQGPLFRGYLFVKTEMTADRHLEIVKSAVWSTWWA